MSALCATVSSSETRTFVRISLFEDGTFITSFPVQVSRWPGLRAVLERGCAATGDRLRVEDSALNDPD